MNFGGRWEETRGGFFPLDDAGPVSEWERNESFCSSIVLVRMSEQKGGGGFIAYMAG